LWPNRAFGGGDQVVPCGVDGRVTVLRKYLPIGPGGRAAGADPELSRPRRIRCQKLAVRGAWQRNQLSTCMVVIGPGHDPERISAIVKAHGTQSLPPQGVRKERATDAVGKEVLVAVNRFDV